MSPQFGFGAIDAEAYVNRARHWDSVVDANSSQKILFDRYNNNNNNKIIIS